jgi:hypothetical protein
VSFFCAAHADRGSQQAMLALAQFTWLTTLIARGRLCVNSGAACVANLSDWAESDDKSGFSGTARTPSPEAGFRTCSSLVIACH